VNADHTDGSLNPANSRPWNWHAGWSVSVGGVMSGSQWSPFTARFKGGLASEAVVRISSVASDTILMAECWRNPCNNTYFTDFYSVTTGSPNSLFLNRPSLAMFWYKAPTLPPPDPTSDPYALWNDQPLTARDCTLLEWYNVPDYPNSPVGYNGAHGNACSVVVDVDSGNIKRRGVFLSMDGYQKLGTTARPVGFDDAYHMGRINVCFADGHVDAWRLRRFTTIGTFDSGYAAGPGIGIDPVRMCEISWWSRQED